jgi:integrase
MVKKRTLSTAPAQAFLDVPLRDMFKPFIATGRDTFKRTFNLLDEAKLLIDDKLVSILDLTPEQVVSNVDIVKDFFIDADGPFQKLEQGRKGDIPLLRQVQLDFDQVLKGGGTAIGKSWLKKTMQTDPIIGGRGGIGKTAWEALTIESKKGGQRKYTFPPDFNPKITAAIAGLKGTAKNVASLAYLGGFRPSDMAKIRLEHIDFATGEIITTATKAGDVEGVLSPALLDIVRQQAGGRTKGLLFEGFTQLDKKGNIVFKTSFQGGINTHLSNAFPEQISYTSPNTKSVIPENVSLHSLRHHVEDVYNKLGIHPKDANRLRATLRPIPHLGTGGAYGIVTQVGDFEDAGKLQARVSSVVTAYSNSTPHTWMTNTGWMDNTISPDTKELIATKNDLKNKTFTNYMKKSDAGLAFYGALPTTPGTLGAVVDVKNIETAVNLGIAQTEGQTLDKQLENIKKQKELLKEEKILADDKKALETNKKFEKLSADERTRAAKLNHKYVDMSADEAIKFSQSKNQKEFMQWVSKYKGAKRASKYAGPLGMAVTLGLIGVTEAAYQMSSPEEFAQPEGSVGDKIAGAMGLNEEDIRQLRLWTNRASIVPIVGDVADIGATLAFPTKTDREMIQNIKDRAAAEKSMDVESDFAIHHKYPDSPISFGTPMKKYELMGEQQQIRGEAQAAQWAEENVYNAPYKNTVPDDITSPNIPIPEKSIDEQINSVLRPVQDTEEDDEDYLTQQQLYLQGGV